jgi:hypothetical protein
LARKRRGRQCSQAAHTEHNVAMGMWFFTFWNDIVEEFNILKRWYQEQI